MLKNYYLIIRLVSVRLAIVAKQSTEAYLIYEKFN